MSEWIRVEDRLPHEGKMGEWFVLACVSGTVNGEKCDYAPEVLTFERSEVAGDIVEEWYDNNFEASFVVHYWMEIPELPEEVTGDA